VAYGVRLHVCGDRALFTRPEMKAERVSYDVMTPSAARGILEAIYWKPSLRWIVDSITVMKPIRFQSIRRNEISSKLSVTTVRRAVKANRAVTIAADSDRQQRATTLLIDVEYIIEAHFEVAVSTVSENDAAKHLASFSRRARKGQCFHQPCFGTREFPAYFCFVEPDATDPPADQTLDRDLGLMLWDIDYADGFRPLFFNAVLEKGVMHVPLPNSGQLHR
jgi:CRISPR-associated protein Cas5d